MLDEILPHNLFDAVYQSLMDGTENVAADFYLHELFIMIYT